MTNGVYWLSIPIDKKDCFTYLGESKCHASRNAHVVIRDVRTYATAACTVRNTLRIPMIAFVVAQPHVVMTAVGEKLVRSSCGDIRFAWNANAGEN